jgi:hypothetical protein
MRDGIVGFFRQATFGTSYSTLSGHFPRATVIGLARVASVISDRVPGLNHTTGAALCNALCL